MCGLLLMRERIHKMKKFVVISLIINSIVVLLSLIFTKYMLFTYNNTALNTVLNGLLLIEMPLFFYFLDKDRKK